MSLLTNLISYWKLDESSGNASDSVGANTGVNNDVTYSAGKINNGGAFNGTSSSLNLGTSTSLRLSAVSVSVWAKASGNTGFIYTKKSSAAGGHEAYGINLGLYEAGKICIRIQQTISTFLDLRVTATFNDSAWHHYVFTYTGTSLILYRDGVNIGSVSEGAIYYDGDFPAYIGSSSDGGVLSDFFSSNIDEVGVWSRVLTASEVTKLYNGGAGLPYPFNTGAFFAFF